MIYSKCYKLYLFWFANYSQHFHFLGGGGFSRHNGLGDQTDDYFGRRRVEREQISIEGISEVWATSPVNPPDEYVFD